MKLVFASLVYLSFAFFLGWGILQAYHGSYTLLLTGALVYSGLLYLIGCRNPQQS
jgi:hypothetical protein